MTKTSVLIVEDELEIAELMRFHVERDGLEARIARTGRQALSAIENQRPDLVLLDLMLPDIDGLEVCRRLKWQADTRHIPVLIVSAKGDEAEKAQEEQRRQEPESSSHRVPLNPS